MEKKERIYKLYWLRTADMTDPKTQGYIGITKNSIYHRFGQHCHSKRPVGATIREIGEDNIIVSELSRGTQEDMMSLEFSFRPKRYIGWNIQAGGNRSEQFCPMCNKHLPKRRIGTICRTCKDTRFQKGSKPHNWGKGRSMELIDPSGRVFYPECLTVFCRQYNLEPNNLRKVANGERRHHKQWKARYLV